ncbi:ABC transporter ATP-binding protein [Ornithinibacillus gellani]|uniref:ABC transporter ATP-binding protein n=1 Tax=Ornithinibacillus gellani TaxID=2293253 RepID=UPI000F4A79F8|nr:ABC transporter ATP-binding protein [Ornithinibacillus gellani]TQS75401.1 ABC transporter ATP-binding protein [Ornithinibacillus gellani]
MSEKAIQISGLTKAYGRNEAVKHIHLDVQKGELFGFLGPNGAGKTTTIKMMTGLLEPSEGTIELNGVDIWKEPIKAKQLISYVPDQPNLYPKLTGWEYLEFISSVFRMEKDTYEKNANELLAIFGLKDRADELIESYSHGMKQKIAICGALVHDPDILFLDEPTVGLDPKSARNLKNLLRSRCDDGMTVFITTHILEIAEQMCDRIGIISHGDIIALGTMDELRALEGGSAGSLEDIFLELTGDEAQQAVIKEMSEQDSGVSP